MNQWTKNVRLLPVGGLLAGLTLASLLAGCGGGGGGGGGGSSPSSPQLVAGPTFVPVGDTSTVAVGNAANGPASTPEVDVSPGAVPSSAGSGINVSIAVDSSPPSFPSNRSAQSAAYDIEPAATNFQQAGITIKIPYTPNSNGLQPLIYYYDTTTSTWQAVTSSTGSASDTYGQSANYVAIQTNTIASGRGANGTGPTDYAVLGASIPGPPP